MGTSIYFAIVSFAILFVAGLTLPFVFNDFGETATTNNTDNLTENVNKASLSIFSSLFGVFLWNFGIFPVWLNMFFLLIKIIFVMAITDMIIP